MNLELNRAADPGAEPSPLRNRRVLMVSEPGTGGVCLYVLKLSRFLLSQGVLVDLAYSSSRSGRDLEELVSLVGKSNGVLMDLRTGSQPNIRDARALGMLVQYTRKHKPDIIHAHSSKAGVLTRAMAALGLKTPQFYTPHAYYAMGKTGLRKSVFNRIEAALARYAFTMNVSDTEANFARTSAGVKPDRQTVIPVGIDCSLFRPPTAEERSAARARLNIPEDARVLGTVARYSTQKDPVNLHTAVRGIMERHPRLWFLHVGAGELSGAVDALGPPHGRIVRVDELAPIVDFYRCIDCFTLPSLYEGMSAAAIEAMACNLPMILTRVNGNSDFGTMGLTGVRWCAAQDVASLQAAIEDWIAAPYADLNHRAIAVQRFNSITSYNLIMDCYRKSLMR